MVDLKHILQPQVLGDPFKIHFGSAPLQRGPPASPTRLLQSTLICTLEGQVSFEVLGNFPTLCWKGCFHQMEKRGQTAPGCKVSCLHCPRGHLCKQLLYFVASWLLCCQRYSSSQLLTHPLLFGLQIS